MASPALNERQQRDTQRATGIQVISRAADILRALGEQSNGMSLGQIAERVALPRSTVQRIVSALVDEGFISTQERDGSIRLGPEIQNLAQATAFELRERIRPVMKSISEQTGETVDLAVLEGNHMRFVEQIVGSQRLRTVSSIGELFPIINTANGKASLACLPKEKAESLIAGMLGNTKAATTQQNKLLREIKAIRNGTLAKDEDEHTDGVSALGFAIEDENGDIYAVSVPVPSSRYRRIKQTLAEVITQYRDEFISKSL